MTTPVTTIGLTFGGTDIQDSDLGIFLEIIEGLSFFGSVRGRDVVVPAANGRVVRNRRFDVLPIVLEGMIRGNGSTQADRQADYRSNVRTVRSLFDPTDDPADLVASLEDGSVWTVAARTLNIMSKEQVISELALVSVELEAVELWSVDEGGS